jgi:pimeloyl-ACP methyl ester carboxylesterase
VTGGQVLRYVPITVEQGGAVANETAVDQKTGRKFYLDHPKGAGPVTFILNLHGGGSVGAWQRAYFPAYQYADRFRLVIATPSAATKEPTRHWAEDADDEHLQNVVEAVVARFGAANIRSFWLVGHSQGGMTSRRLLSKPYFADRVDGFLSLSGGRLGSPAPISEDFLPPGLRDAGRPRPFRVPQPEVEQDISFIFATGEHEIEGLPETSPLAQRMGAGARARQDDVVDEEPGQIHDTRWDDGGSSRGWGLKPRPGTAEVWLYPGARGGRVVADVVRLDKGHTEGLEPNITQKLLEILTSASGGRLTAKG